MTLARHPHDLYTTNEALTEHLLAHLPSSLGTVLEPCDGQGHISRVLHRFGHKVITTDITHADTDQFVLPRDATTPEFWEQWGGVDWVITNPPYNQAESIVPQAYAHAKRGVAMLLRISWIMEPCTNRAPFLRNSASQLSHVIPFNPRPQFRADTKNTDNATVAWAIWDKHHPGGTQVVYVTNWR